MLRYGWRASSVPKYLRAQRDGLGNDIRGTDGWAHHCNPGKVLLLAQLMAQQGWTDDEVRKHLLDPINCGSLWLRRHDDPDAALASMLSRVDRTRKPLLPMSERHRRILAALQTGEVLSQKALIRVVDHPHERDVRSDLRALAEAGAITMTPEEHGQTIWWLISIGVATSVFWDLAVNIRLDVGRRVGLRKMRARVKEWFRRSKAHGCLGLTAGRTRVSPVALTRHAKEGANRTERRTAPRESKSRQEATAQRSGAVLATCSDSESRQADAEAILLALLPYLDHPRILASTPSAKVDAGLQSLLAATAGVPQEPAHSLPAPANQFSQAR